MSREETKKKKHKSPKFKDYYDEDVSYEEKLEIQNSNKKSGKKPQRENTREKW
ncbi:MAG: hypothetical protein ABIJ31_01450 [Pseudomonadota bacterium]